MVFGAFQFPVGMSNRSYKLYKLIDYVVIYPLFQFPVGMSNRSYDRRRKYPT